MRPAAPAVVCLIACAGLSSGARAAALAWDGTLSLDFVAPGIAPLEITGAGAASVNAQGGGVHLTDLVLAGGITGSGTAVVSGTSIPTAIASVRASVTLASGTLSPFSPPALPGQRQLTKSTLPVRGAVKLCVFFPDCGAAVTLDLTAASGDRGLGIGGTLTVNGFGAGTRVSLLAAPWTVGTASMPLVTSGGGTLGLVTGGWRHGAASFTSSTAITGGALSLVSPLQVTSSAGQELALFARLTVRFVPEPGRALLLAAGLAGLALLHRCRRHL